MTAKELRNCAHRLIGEDAPCRGLDEGIEIVAKVYLNDLGAGVLQPPNHFAKRLSTSKSTRSRNCRGAKASRAPFRSYRRRGLRSLFTSHDLIHQKTVLNAAGEYARRVERMRDRRNAVARPTPGGRLEPTTPQNDAGTRIDPTVSPPKDAGTRPAATDAAEPLEEPPDTRSRACGFFTWPNVHYDRSSRMTSRRGYSCRRPRRPHP